MPNKLTHWKLSCQDIFSSWSRKHRFTVYAWWDKFSVYFWAVSSTWNDYGLKGMTAVLDISPNNMSLWCAAFHLELKKEQSWQVQWNTIIKCQWAGEICLLYRVFLISKTSIWQIFRKTTKTFVILQYTLLIFNAELL